MPLTTRPSPRHPVCPVCSAPFKDHAYRLQENQEPGRRGPAWPYQCGACGHTGKSKHEELRDRPLKAETHPTPRGRVERNHYTLAKALRDIRKLYGWNLKDLATVTRLPLARASKLTKGEAPSRAERTLLKRFARRIDHRRLLELLTGHHDHTRTRTQPMVAQGGRSQ